MAPITRINEMLSVAGQIDAADIGRLAAEGYGTIINNRPDGEEAGQLDHETAAAEAAKYDLVYRYQPVTNNSIDRKEVVDFHNSVTRGPHPVLAYCRSGTRCYLLWAATRVLFGHESPLILVAEGAAQGYDLRILPSLIAKLEAQK